MARHNKPYDYSKGVLIPVSLKEQLEKRLRGLYEVKE